MERIYKFAILRATPDPRRGEVVNIGIVVFHSDRLDVRFAELQKLRSLTGRDWDEHAISYRARTEQVAKLFESDEDRLKALGAFEKVITPSKFGWVEAPDDDKYEERIGEILRGLVAKNIPDRKPREQRINTEIALEFRKHKILAKPTEDVFSHKIVRNLDFRKHKGLRADFVLKNGVYHVTATLDLRKTSVRIDEAALKSIVLDRAKEEFDGEKRLFGVYAAPMSELHNFKDHIDLLGSYADDVFNWSDPAARVVYQRRMYDALDRSFGSN